MTIIENQTLLFLTEDDLLNFPYSIKEINRASFKYEVKKKIMTSSVVIFRDLSGNTKLLKSRH